MFPKLWEVSIVGYQTSQTHFNSAELAVMTDENGKLLSYTISYDINAILTPNNMPKGFQDETLYLTETISYIFNTTDTAVIVEPSEAYLALQ